MMSSLHLLLAFVLHAEAWSPRPSTISSGYHNPFQSSLRNVPRTQQIQMAAAASTEEEIAARTAEIAALVAKGHHNKVVRKYKLLRKMGGGEDGATYRGVLTSCAQAKIPQISEKVIQDMVKNPPQDGIKLIDMKLALLACARGSRPVEALQILAAMKEVNIDPDLDCFHMALTSCVQAKAGTRIDQIVDKLLAKMQRRSIKANFETSKTLLQVLVRARHYQEALATFEVMCIEGNPTADTYKLAITAASKLKDVGTIKSLLSEMLVDPLLAEDAVSVLPKAAKSVADSGDWRLACKLLKRIDSPSMHTFHSVIASCGRAKNSKMAILLFEQMRETVPANQVKRATMNAVLNACQQTGDEEGAQWIIDIMSEAGIRVNVVTYNIAINARAQVGDYPGAIHLIGQMEEEGIKPSVVSFATAMNAAAKGNSSTAAVRLLSAMESHGLTPNEYVFTSCMAACENDVDDHSAAENAQVIVDKLAQVGVADVDLKARLAAQVTRQLRRDPSVVKNANVKLDEQLLDVKLSGRQMAL